MNETQASKRAKEENVYQRAAAICVAREFALDPDHVAGVDFCVHVDGYCETCAYETTGVEFVYRNGREIRAFDITPGQFIEECVKILTEQA